MTGTEHSNQSNPKADACGAPTSPTFVQAQPIGTYAIPRTIYIQNSVSPLTVQPTTLDLQGLPTTMRRTPPPRGRWSDAILARHLYGYSKVLDGDGDPHRPDGYGLLV
eukprot:scaffold3051_cov167-Ochromonas_danica.AAC.36